MSVPAGFRWCHTALILAGVNAISALPAGFGGDFAFYNSFRQPAIAPPDWAFTAVYFLLHSPVLAAADTVVGLLAGLVSQVCAFRLDRLSAGFILLRVLWLVLATYVSLFVALSNPDPFLGIGALW
jgi:tryptophan-rich sensory protein